MAEDPGNYDKLLDRVRSARSDYEAKQDEVQDARDRYYAAVRALNAAGMPLREVADALGLSHQRVHQMVGEAESSTRRRVGKAAKAGGIGLLLALLVVGVALLIDQSNAPKEIGVDTPTVAATDDVRDKLDKQSRELMDRFTIGCHKGSSCHLRPWFVIKRSGFPGTNVEILFRHHVRADIKALRQKTIEEMLEQTMLKKSKRELMRILKQSSLRARRQLLMLRAT